MAFDTEDKIKQKTLIFLATYFENLMLTEHIERKSDSRHQNIYLMTESSVAGMIK